MAVVAGLGVGLSEGDNVTPPSVGPKGMEVDRLGATTGEGAPAG